MHEFISVLGHVASRLPLGYDPLLFYGTLEPTKRLRPFLRSLNAPLLFGRKAPVSKILIKPRIEPATCEHVNGLGHRSGHLPIQSLKHRLTIRMLGLKHCNGLRAAAVVLLYALASRTNRQHSSSRRTTGQSNPL
jgi:hypothetical protein